MKPKLLLLILIFLLTSTLVAQDETITPQDLADENGQFAQVNDASIYYIAEGNPDNPAVILIHGFGGSTFTWRDNIQLIADAGYYVIALDLPPFGLSDKTPEIGYTRSDYADYVVRLMDTLNIDTATIVGHSMGGTVTAYVAVQYSSRIDNLIFVDGGVFDTTLTAEETSEVEDQEDASPFGFLDSIDLSSPNAASFLETVLRPALFAQIMQSAYYDPEIVTDEVVSGYTRPLQLDNWAEGFIGFLTAQEENIVTLDNLVEVADMPILIIWGEEDTWIPLSAGQTMNEALPTSQLVTYPLVGHLPMEETVQSFNQDLITFLDENRD